MPVEELLVIHDGQSRELAGARALAEFSGAPLRGFDDFASADLARAGAVIIYADPRPDPRAEHPRGLFWLFWLGMHLAYDGRVCFVTSERLDLGRFGPEAAWLDAGWIALAPPSAKPRALIRRIESTPRLEETRSIRATPSGSAWVRYDAAALVCQASHRLENWVRNAKCLLDPEARLDDDDENHCIERLRTGQEKLWPLLLERFEAVSTVAVATPEDETLLHAARSLADAAARMGVAVAGLHLGPGESRRASLEQLCLAERMLREAAKTLKRLRLEAP